MPNIFNYYLEDIILLQNTEHNSVRSSSIYKGARFVSNVFHPMLVSSLAFLPLIITNEQNQFQKSILLIISSVLFSSVIPFVFLYSQREKLNTDDRAERFLPLIVGIVSYFLGFCVLSLMDAPEIVQALMFCYATNTLIILLITQWWKVSVHTTAITGPLVALSYNFGIVMIPFFLLVLLIGSSRVILNKHTIAQVIVGALIGLIGTGTQIYYIFQIPFSL